jgi:hypothetical protein
VTRRETATRLIAQKVILDELIGADKAARLDAKAGDFDEVGVREIGKLGDLPVGTVQLNKGRESWVIADQRAFLAWVQENRPGEIITTPTVRTSYADAVKAACKKDGGVVDEATGELIVPPGVELREGDPTLTVKPAPEARAAVLEALGVEPRKMLGIGGE